MQNYWMLKCRYTVGMLPLACVCELFKHVLLASSSLQRIIWEFTVGGVRYCLVVKYWLRVLQMDKEVPVMACYEWQINNEKCGSGQINVVKN
jgi:hypothetical protein